MSTWNLGIDDVSNETRAFRDKLASKDSQIAAQKDRISKQAAEYDDLNERFNNAMHKLATEAQRALDLELQLQQRTEDLRNERITSENGKSALASNVEKNKATIQELRQLELTLEKISNTSDEHLARASKLEREKSALEVRVKELESNLNNHPTPMSTTTPGRKVMARPRSSSLSNFRITTLEQDLNDTRSILAKKEQELETITSKLSQSAADVLKYENDKAATERKWNAEVEVLKSFLGEKEEELTYLREQQGDGGREEELLKRIEEDDAKIAALELMLRGTEDIQPLKSRLHDLELQLKEEKKLTAVATERQNELTREKETVLDELETSRRELHRLLKELHERKVRDHAFRQKAVKTLEECEDPLMADNSCLIDIDTLDLSPPPPPPPQPETDADTITHIERLLLAIERLRGERDSLRRDVQFLESESRFAIEALEAKLSASMSTASNHATLATIDQLRAEMDEMHAQMIAVSEQYQATNSRKTAEINRLGLQVQGLAIALSRVDYQRDAVLSDKISLALVSGGNEVVRDNPNNQPVITQAELDALINERDYLVHELETKEAHWEQQVDAARMADHESRERLDDAMCDISELNDHLEELESERDSLALQLTNLMTDLQIAQQELGNAETRYTNLQFHQLNTMTSNEATRTLREHIEELENRVMRRTEQIGIHQHDIRRLETNLRLQEERLTEMTTEMEMIMEQKDAMVEDCADARETRDEALARVETLEEELEAVEGRNNENNTLVTTLIAVIADTVSNARHAIHEAKAKTKDVETDLSDAQEVYSATKQELDEKVANLTMLGHQSDEHRAELKRIQLALSQHENEAAELSVRVKGLQEEKLALLVEVASLQSRNSKPDTPHKHADVHPQVQNDGQEFKSTNDNAESTLVQLKLQHADALGLLQGRLVETESALETLQTLYDSSKADYQRSSEDAQKSIRELEERLEGTTTTLSELQKLHEQVSSEEKDRTKKIQELEQKLEQSQKAHKDASETCRTLEFDIKGVTEELERLQDQNALLNEAQTDYQAMRQEMDKRIQSLQGRFEEETRLLEMSKEEVTRLTERLTEETCTHIDDQKAHIAALESASERVDTAEQLIAQLQADIAVSQKDLQDMKAQLLTTEQEKTALLEEITTHEAEVQKYKSLNRYLEGQIKDNDQIAANLTADIERLRADLARSEKACKAAEVNLSLQNAQHKRETSEFQRELAALRIRPNLEHALSELEERNSEMEELLRAKCAEIEENDDRVLEMLKEKKKLSTKVESLNRKVQNLQAKLAAAKASLPGSSSITNPSSAIARHESPPAATIPRPLAKSVSPSLVMVTQPAQSSNTPFSRPRSATASSAPQPVASSSITPPSLKRKPSERIVSGPSSTLRPKTPERNRAVAPVFKARTPEHRIVPDIDSMASAVVIGKKRAAPDDFEVCEGMPAQAFTADGEDVENKTPRVRRVLNSLQSGFTPLRNQAGRPTAPIPSPRRTAPPRSSPFISDMTNTPNVASAAPTSMTKQSNKRSWLGKIRGGSQVAERPSDSKPYF